MGRGWLEGARLKESPRLTGVLAEHGEKRGALDLDDAHRPLGDRRDRRLVPQQQRQLAQHFARAPRRERRLVAGIVGEEEADAAFLDVVGRLGLGALFDQLVAVGELLRLPCGLEQLLDKLLLSHGPTVAFLLYGNRCLLCVTTTH